MWFQSCAVECQNSEERLSILVINYAHQIEDMNINSVIDKLASKKQENKVLLTFINLKLIDGLIHKCCKYIFDESEKA